MEDYGFTTFLIVIIVLALPFAFLTGFIADRKGHNAGNWFFAALVFQIFSLIAICAIPVKEKEPPKKRQGSTLPKQLQTLCKKVFDQIHETTPVKRVNFVTDCKEDLQWTTEGHVQVDGKEFWGEYDPAQKENWIFVYYGKRYSGG